MLVSYGGVASGEPVSRLNLTQVLLDQLPRLHLGCANDDDRRCSISNDDGALYLLECA